MTLVVKSRLVDTFINNTKISFRVKIVIVYRILLYFKHYNIKLRSKNCGTRTAMMVHGQVQAGTHGGNTEN